MEFKVGVGTFHEGSCKETKGDSPRSKFKLSCLHQKSKSLKDEHQRLVESTKIGLNLLFGILFMQL
jgi:hypothetical protein